MEFMAEKDAAYSIGRAMIERSLKLDATELDRVQGQVALLGLQFAEMKAQPILEPPTIAEVARAGLGGRTMPEPAIVVGNQSGWGEVLAILVKLSTQTDESICEVDSPGTANAGEL